jgi:hypothetical protein
VSYRSASTPRSASCISRARCDRRYGDGAL